MAKLFAQTGHSLELPARRVSFGVASSCDIPLTAEGLAEEHFSISYAKGQSVLQDLTGGNPGIQVNGQPMTEVKINHGDVITAGELRLAFWDPEPQPRDMASPFLAGAVLSGPAPHVLTTHIPQSAPAPELAPLSEEEQASLRLARIFDPDPEPMPVAMAVAAPLPPTPAPIPMNLPPTPITTPHSAEEAANAKPKNLTVRIPLIGVIPNPSTPRTAPQRVPHLTMATMADRGSMTPEGELKAATQPVPGIVLPLPEAWVNPVEMDSKPVGPVTLTELPTVSALPPPPGMMPAAPAHPAPHHGAAPAPLKIKKRRGALIKRPGAIAALLALTGVVVALQTAPGRKLTSHYGAKFSQWIQPSKVAPAMAEAAPAAKPPVTAKAPQLESNSRVLDQTKHREIVQSFLTEKTMTLCYADLTQLVPYYNTNAAARSLPAVAELAAAFQRQYGILFDGFSELTCLRTASKDDFIFILTSPKPVDVQSLLGMSTEKYQSLAFPPGRTQRLSKPISLANNGNLPIAGALYDPFTVVVGHKLWLDSVFNFDNSPVLREATCIFPKNAFRKPGAMIISERLASVYGANTAGNQFETSISNLFFRDKGESTLTLTRAPSASSETFVDTSTDALKSHLAALLKISKGSPDRVIAKQREAEVHLGDSEASVNLPDGEAFLAQAVEGVARNFLSKLPNVELIQAANQAMSQFNKARQARAEDTLNVREVTEALNLLVSGINGSGNQRSSVYKIEPLDQTQMAALSSLLAYESKTGLVFRPSAKIHPSLADMALKARDYRNAEMLTYMWAKSAMKPTEAPNATAAVRKLMAWAKDTGSDYRAAIGIPILTEDEIKGAAKLLDTTSGKLTWRSGEMGYRNWLRGMGADAPQLQSSHSHGRASTPVITPFKSLRQSLSPRRR